MHPSIRRCLLLLTATLLAVVTSGTAVAERWRLAPAASLQMGYDDNVRLTDTNPEGAFWSRGSGVLRLVRSTEISALAFSAGVAATRYAGLPDLNNTGGFAGLNLQYRMERQQVRVGVHFDSQSTLYSEGPQTSLVRVNQQQNTASMNAGWTYQLSERAALNLDASYQDVFYDSARAVSLSNYRLGVVNLGGSYFWTERLRLTGRLSYGRYETQGHTNGYESVGIQGGADYQLSETSSVAALLGVRRTQQTLAIGNLPSVSNDSSSPIYSLSYTKRFEASGALSLQARRALAPSGNSQVTDTTGCRQISACRSASVGALGSQRLLTVTEA
jgi:hypothetical protein